ncbi:MAG: MBL fold metallo-hydrolase [Dehalococcoidales bacterium]|nr:MBL fold metallo-hydrolase [Dehalococcoidales bacterium]
MIEEIIPNLYRAEIPLPKSPLKWLNSYIVKGGDRFLIIDTGFNREECLNEMNATVQKLGVDLNKTDIFVTHLHVDHMGLTGTLAQDSSKVYFNAPEAKQINAQRENWTDYWQKLMDVYVANGFPADTVRNSMESHPAHKYGLKRKVDFTIVKDGDVIDIGDFHFKCVSTSGHSPGHTSLYEPNKKILVAGDHILFDITPNIAYWLEMGDSLGEYLANLDKVDALDVNLVLTGHRRLVHDLHGRVRELKEHHRARLDEVLAALDGRDLNALQIAPHIKWDITARTWEEFPPPQKWFAFGETMAHVIYLEKRGKVRRNSPNGKAVYSLA